MVLRDLKVETVGQTYNPARNTDSLKHVHIYVVKNKNLPIVVVWVIFLTYFSILKKFIEI